jgi:hypothetical protein
MSLTDIFLLRVLPVIPPTLAALAAWYSSLRARKKIIELHLSVNSRLDELLEARFNAGVAQGVREERDRNQAAAKSPNE